MISASASRTTSVRGLAASLLLCAAAAYGHGEFHIEINHTDELIATHPGEAWHWQRRAFLNLGHGDWQASLVDLEHAERLGVVGSEISCLRAQALIAGGKLEAARAVLDDLIRAHSDSAPARITRARLLMKVNQPALALCDYRSGLELTPCAEPDLIQEVADALASNQLVDEAVRLIDQQLQRLHHHAGLVMRVVEWETSLGRYESALVRVEAMMKAAPRPEPWMARRASVLAQAGRLDDSRAAWRSLFTHVQSLPGTERSSHAMQRIAEQASLALASLASLSNPSKP